MRIALILVAALPATALAADYSPPGPSRYIDAREVQRSYSDTADNFRQDYMRRLNQLCASKSANDLRKCEEAWSAINAAYAQLQAKKARATD